MDSRHYMNDREAREALIKKISEGKIIKSVRVDRGHKNGAEIHHITDNAIVIIENERTKRMITKLIARPGQIARYYEQGKAPKELMRIAREHQANNYNNY